MKSHRVRVWAIRVNTVGTAGKKSKKSYTVRWTVASREKARNFVSRALADNFRSELMQAINRGEAFDVEIGLPDSMIPKEDEVTWLTFVQRYVTMKWPGSAAKSRDSMTDALATVTPVLVADVAGRPSIDNLRRALREYLLRPAGREQEPPAELAGVIRWLRKASLPLSKLTQAALVRDALDALALTLDGRAAAATTSRRKRSVFYNVLQYAVELELLDFNPVDKLRVRSNRKKVVDAVDRRVVVSPRQARELLAAVTYVGQRGTGTRGERLRAFFGCLYFAALRPGEAMGLHHQNCHLPDQGWGWLTLESSRPAAGKRWTDNGAVHDVRGLKHRGDDEARTVPIPPELVALIRAHVDRFGTGEDGRLFRSENGNPVASSTYSRVWKETRRLALLPHQVDSPLAGRPYDLRHAGVSLWLNAGVHAPEVAERAGHSVEVLLKVYAKCIDGDARVMNERIDKALGT